METIEFKVTRAREVHMEALDLQEQHTCFWPAILFGGDRILHCDEGIVARKDGRVVGFSSIAPKGESGNGDPEIVGVYIVPPERRKGIGLALLRATFDRCRERGFTPSVIGVTIEGKALLSKYYSGALNRGNHGDYHVR